ncbi:MAG TPA: coproporphyrinogen III oxidase family protein [Thiothrix sp.]|nr:coproporphyrinogen III oxidase family protein [Thiothrix sp.]
MDSSTDLTTLLAGSPYLNYLYSYPHKTAYRALKKPQSLKQLWQAEDKDALFLYMHIPFCEMRCGFCNLFTTANPQQSLINRYLDQLEQQALQIDKALGNYNITNLAIGGGTPSYLTTVELQRLFSIAQHSLGINLASTPIGIEVSPATVTEDRLDVFVENQVNRISIGIESFIVSEANAMGRPQKQQDVEHALCLIQQANIDILNIDLIYGGEGQSLTSWLESVAQAIHWQADEIYLYPLYIRPLTGLGRKGERHWDDQRMNAYLAACDVLGKAGYQQISMRLFRRKASIITQQGEYHCQEDGMIGLGCGARSYTRAMHYSFDYAVKRQGVLDIIQQYNQLDTQALSQAHYGIVLNEEEQKRRYTLLSLLQCEGMSRHHYKQLFNTEVLDDLPQLQQLEECAIARIDNDTIRLNAQGIAYSDVIGTWLYSSAVRRKMTEYQTR